MGITRWVSYICYCWNISGSHQHPLIFVHIAYFTLLSLLGAVSLWVFTPSKLPPSHHISFLDALFNAVSAVSETGLATMAMHRFSTPNQITIIVLMLMGSPVFTSAIPLYIMRFYPLAKHSSLSLASQSTIGAPLERQEHVIDSKTKPTFPPIKEELSSSEKDGITVSLHSIKLNELDAPPTKGLPLGGHQTCNQDIEDSALLIMIRVTSFYLLVSIMLGFLICLLSILRSPHAVAVLKQNHVSPSFFSLFSTVSAFGNCGFLPLDDNMVPLQRSIMLVLCLSFLILIGNTCYAPMLRFVLTCLQKTSKGHHKQVYAHLLLTSTRRYTHLFSSQETKWLLFTVVFLNGFQIISILGLDWRSQALDALGAGYKLAATLLQSVCARTGGMNVVYLVDLSTTSKLVLLGGMYIAAYPLQLTSKQDNEKMRRRNATKLKLRVFREQLLGVRTQNAFLFLATFLICVFERESIKNDPINFAFFNILFEVVSSYGNVGLSIGYSCDLRTTITLTRVCSRITYSLSGMWSASSKMVLIIVMLVGRHKALPADIDWKASPSHF